MGLRKFGQHATRALFSASLATTLTVVGVGQAQTLDLPPGGGLGAISVRVDVAGRVVTHGSERTPIELPAGEATATVTAVPVGDGRGVAHVIVTTKDKRATWEAIVAPTEAGKSTAVFAGRTGFASGEGGEQRGEAVAIYERPGEAARSIVIGALDEAVTLCGEPRTLLAPRALDPKTMTLRPASVQQIGLERLRAAAPVVARPHAGPPEPALGRLLSAVGSSDERAPAGPLVDGDPATVWHEARSGAGTGDFVVLRAPSRVPIRRLTLVPLPPKGPGAAPKSIYLVTNETVLAVELPEDAAKTRASFDVVFPAPLRTSCLAVTLDQAYAPAGSKPEVSIAEVVAYSDLDTEGATHEAAARKLSGGGESAEVAAEVLKRGGPKAAAAIATVLPTLDGRGRMLALEVASAAGGCDVSSEVFVRALADEDKDVSARAEKMLLGCGPAAAPRLLTALTSEGPMGKARAAGVLSLVAPSRALRPIAAALATPKLEAPVRSLLRTAFGRAAKHATGDALGDVVAEAPREARPELIRALHGRLVEIRERASLIVNEWLEKDPSFAARYLALEPLAELAQAGDAAATTRFVAMLGGDRDWGVRARAAALAGPVPAAHGALLHGLEDSEPRVREASLRATGEQRTTAAAVRVGTLLAHDPWTFVRLAAASALGGMAPAPDIDRSLADGLADASPRVRESALEALGQHRASAFASPVRERLADEKEALDVRVAAVATLGRMCDGESLDTFTKAARRLSTPFPERSELALGTASLRALAAVHPKDLERRIAPLLDPSVRSTVRELAQRALTEPGECR